jgi:hypothetical protein
MCIRLLVEVAMSVPGYIYFLSRICLVVLYLTVLHWLFMRMHNLASTYVTSQWQSKINTRRSNKITKLQKEEKERERELSFKYKISYNSECKLGMSKCQSECQGECPSLSVNTAYAAGYL